MINSAALWPLLDPQWRDPRKWWKELATASGRKDYDWAHLARRYWPRRVDQKCHEDPSLGVAHGCFWRYHPARAWAWELRLQDEIAPDFRITEAPYDGDNGDAPYRAAWLAERPADALAAIEKEVLRRRRKQKKPVPEMVLQEAGLWASFPADLWALELALSEKQGVETFVRAPDEPGARAAFEADHPDLVERRRVLVQNLAPAAEMQEQDDEGAEPPEDEETEA
jgi:hypothetical protein